MKRRTGESIMAFIAGVLAFVCVYLLLEEAGASDYRPAPEVYDGR